jgi:glycosyltransferase involved in cell wall biosynthesis
MSKFHKPPDVAFLIQSLDGGGAERIVLNLAQNFVERGFKVDLLLCLAHGEFLAEVVPEIRIIQLSNNHFKKLFKLIRYLRQEKPANLIAVMYPQNEIAILAKFFSGKSTKIIVTIHTMLSGQHYMVQFPLMAIGRIHAMWVKFVARLLYVWADEIVAVSKGAARDLSLETGIPLDQIRVIYNPVISSKLFAQAQQTLKHSWFQAGEPPVILGVGRLHQVKDFSTLIRAFAIVKQARAVRLMILGTGPEKEKLKNLVHTLELDDVVLMPGFVDNPYKYMANSTVFALSSRFESMGTVLIESMALGTPIVSTNAPTGAVEVLNNGQYGEIVAVNDSQSLAGAIQHVLDGNVKQIDPMWLENFTVDKNCQKYLDIFKVAEVD